MKKGRRAAGWAALSLLVGRWRCWRPAAAAAGTRARLGRRARRRVVGPALPTSIGPGEGQLSLVAWEGYAQDQWVKPFEKQTGCKVQRKYAGSSDEMVTLMRAGRRRRVRPRLGLRRRDACG